MKNLEKAFQAIGAYDRLCIPPDKNKETYMVEVINCADPYKAVVIETASRILTNAMNRKICATSLAIIHPNEATFLNVHCQVKTLNQLKTFLSKPFITTHD